MTCPKSYELHYKKRWREKTNPASFLFGGAIDNAVMNILYEKMGDSKFVPNKDIFMEAMLVKEINGELVDVPKSELLRYSNSDFDKDVLTDENIVDIQKYALTLFPPEDDEPIIPWLDIFKNIKENKNILSYDNIPVEEIRFFNYVSWLSLVNKGRYMLDAFVKQILPRIKKVHSIQKEVNLDNGEDRITGFIDMVIDWDEEGNTHVMDLKTSSIVYAEDSVRTSQQLIVYCENEGIDKAGFIILKKHIGKNKTKVCSLCKNNGDGSRAKTCDAISIATGKRCSGAWIETISLEGEVQIVTDVIREHQKNLIFDNIVEINNAIHNNIFPRNFNSCVSNFGKCTYYEMCHFNKTDNLINLNKEK